MTEVTASFVYGYRKHSKKIESAWLLQMLDLYNNIRVQPLGPYRVISHRQAPKNIQTDLVQIGRSLNVLTLFH